MKLRRRSFLRLAAGAAALPVLPKVAAAQEYPARPVRVIVCFPPGFAADITGRLISEHLGVKLGQQFIVDNRPGAGGDVGVEAVVKSAPDGYTLLLTTSGNSISASLDDNPRFNLVRDIAPVAMVGTSPYIMLANNDVPAKTLAEFIAYAKANPGKLNIASPGVASGPHIVGELFKMNAGVDLVHVPYRSSFFPDLLSGQVQVAFGPLSQGFELYKEGKLRAYGVSSPARLESLPDLPAIAETIKGFEATAWFGVSAPKGTPPEIIAKLNGAINEILGDATVKARLATLGIAPNPMKPADFSQFISTEVDKWKQVVKFANVKRA